MPGYRFKLRDERTGDAVSIFLRAPDQVLAVQRARELIREAARTLAKEQLATLHVRQTKP